ncbi:MAG: acyl-CoA dehydrogenase [Dehalococcoidia bacterium]|nr:MAG: acyl-CoA dehydrogenase [Dehalococcoidia bacterium]
MTLCTTDASKGDEGVAIIYVPRETPGLSFGPPEAKMGLVYTEYNGAIYYDDVRVPKEYRAAGPGIDSELLHDILTVGKIGTAALALGPAQAAFEIALEYTKSRFIVGKQVRERSMHAGMIADMAIALESARAYYIQVAKMMDRPDLYGRLGTPFMHGKASGAKVLACDTAIMVTNKAMELMGSMGCSEGMHVEKYLRDTKIMQLVEGGAQLARLDMARSFYPFEW